MNFDNIYVYRYKIIYLMFVTVLAVMTSQMVTSQVTIPLQKSPGKQRAAEGLFLPPLQTSYLRGRGIKQQLMKN